jgi:hypothetical protein
MIGLLPFPERSGHPIFDCPHNDGLPQPHFAHRFLRPHDVPFDAILSHSFFSFHLSRCRESNGKRMARVSGGQSLKAKEIEERRLVVSRQTVPIGIRMFR